MFDLLQTLIAVYETGQFTMAADELKVSQSTVSSRIAQLERLVDAPLFDRHAKSDVTPTEAGRLLYESAVDICGSWRDVRDAIARNQSAHEPFTMLFSHTTAGVLLPRALATVADRLDRFDVSAHAQNSDTILEQVGLKSAQLGVVEKPIINDSVNRVTLCEDQLVLAGDPEGVWMMREHGSGVRYYTDLYCKSVGLVPGQVVEVSSNAAIAASLAGGVGQSVISKACVPHGVAIRDLGPEFTRRFYALVPRSGLTRAQHELVDQVVDALRR
ncbi:LysR family transcriptional regulator [Bifidobacterium eulemuris]|uniref:LysR family transcriptional regulator n=1 Tax=Bifidobacterium eulemuris TaxID=1765219 RepID=A0A261GD33_9BIFI|nr:LysR family transcriptional regulator [Bifidobacterium eulemuris]OZG69359.1 LysR family transcriptional regulator [Bifidobacterium eulemuris]QOL31152.1 LysR family transcriptional regulator [Bifidobacterium eulemuris]